MRIRESSSIRRTLRCCAQNSKPTDCSKVAASLPTHASRAVAAASKPRKARSTQRWGRAGSVYWPPWVRPTAPATSKSRLRMHRPSSRASALRQSMNTSPSFSRFFAQSAAIAAAAQPMLVRGRLTRVAGLVMEAVGLKLPLGSQVMVVQDESLRVDAEVVGFSGERLFLMPTTEPVGLRPGALVVPQEAVAPRPRASRDNHPRRRVEDRARHLPMGEQLLGRVLDPNGRPLDRLGPIDNVTLHPLARRPINAMDREKVAEPLDVGVRAINALLTVGRGQRMGLFAGAGVGKSVLLGMMSRFTSADVTVVGLVGERGREVKEFIEDILGTQGHALSAA